ncbi:unnamed protein product [Tuber aestivum]|uniref:Uncharacterized protein n=1 Tax=Tuber aestivum TaxID=59557 RepID=A0A292Q3U2_9PEZI|nr:unnamed protein product [Tuber aestivum]
MPKTWREERGVFSSAGNIDAFRNRGNPLRYDMIGGIFYGGECFKAARLCLGIAEGSESRAPYGCKIDELSSNYTDSNEFSILGTTTTETRELLPYRQEQEEED